MRRATALRFVLDENLIGVVMVTNMRCGRKHVEQKFVCWVQKYTSWMICDDEDDVMMRFVTVVWQNCVLIGRFWGAKYFVKYKIFSCMDKVSHPPVCLYVFRVQKKFQSTKKFLVWTGPDKLCPGEPGISVPLRAMSIGKYRWHLDCRLLWLFPWGEISSRVAIMVSCLFVWVTQGIPTKYGNPAL